MSPIWLVLPQQTCCEHKEVQLQGLQGYGNVPRPKCPNIVLTTFSHITGSTFSRPTDFTTHQSVMHSLGLCLVPGLCIALRHSFLLPCRQFRCYCSCRLGQVASDHKVPQSRFISVNCWPVLMTRYPLLLEVGAERLASTGKPATSPVWTNPLSKDGPPVLPGITTLYESFRCAASLLLLCLCCVNFGASKTVSWAVGSAATAALAVVHLTHRSSCLKFPNKPCLGHRPIIDGVAGPYEVRRSGPPASSRAPAALRHCPLWLVVRKVDQLRVPCCGA